MKILLAILAAFVLLIGGCSFFVYKAVNTDYPDYAKQEVVDVVYGNLISSVKTSIEASHSKFDLLARLEKIKYPENTLYVGIKEQEGDDEFVILKKFASKSSSTTIVGDYGYGTLNKQEIIILSVSNNKYALKNVVIYLKHLPV